jgi:hypothetical protein
MIKQERIERTARRIVRQIANCCNETQPVVLIAEAGGKDTIGFTGERWHYETRGGRRIWHPTSYSKRGWSNMVYCSSTRQLECGQEFFAFLVRFLKGC